MSLKIEGFKLSVFFILLIRQPNPLIFSDSYIYSQICSLSSQTSPQSSTRTLFSVGLYQLYSHPSRNWSLPLVPPSTVHPYLIAQTTPLLHAMQVFGLSEAQSILCPSPALSCLVGLLPYITRHLLSTGIQVDSASGRPWMDWSMGEGKKPEYFSLPICLRVGWWYHKQQLHLLCWWHQADSFSFLAWLSTLQTAPTLGAVTAWLPEVWASSITPFSFSCCCACCW